MFVPFTQRPVIFSDSSVKLVLHLSNSSGGCRVLLLPEERKYSLGNTLIKAAHALSFTTSQVHIQLFPKYPYQTFQIYSSIRRQHFNKKNKPAGD